MKETELEKRPVVVITVCDMCERVLQGEHDNWAPEDEVQWRKITVSVSMYDESDGEGNSFDSLDICPKCFKIIEKFVKQYKNGEIK